MDKPQNDKNKQTDQYQVTSRLCLLITVRLVTSSGGVGGAFAIWPEFPKSFHDIQNTQGNFLSQVTLCQLEAGGATFRVNTVLHLCVLPRSQMTKSQVTK